MRVTCQGGVLVVAANTFRHCWGEHTPLTATTHKAHLSCSAAADCGAVEGQLWRLPCAVQAARTVFQSDVRVRRGVSERGFAQHAAELLQLC